MAADAPAPMFIGPQNCEAVCGQPWRWLRDFMRSQGIRPMRLGGKSVFRAETVREAFELAASAMPAAPPSGGTDELSDEQQQAALARSLGLTRAA